jgi:hypothetical protein
MKTKNQTTDKQLALHDIQELRQRLTAGPVSSDQARTWGAAHTDSAVGLSSASGLMVA